MLKGKLKSIYQQTFLQGLFVYATLTSIAIQKVLILLRNGY